MTTATRTDGELLFEAISIRGWRGVLLGDRSKKPPPTDEHWQVTSDVEVIARHLQRGNNVGLVTHEDTGIAVLDDDRPDLWIEMVRELGRPGEPWVETGSGKNHYYIPWQPDLPAKIMWRGQKVGEIQRGPGQQQVVAPPSIHPDTGRSYRWLVNPAIEPLEALPAEWTNYFAQSTPQRESAHPPDADLETRAMTLLGARRRGDKIKFACAACLSVGDDREHDNGCLFLDTGQWGCAGAAGTEWALIHKTMIGIQLGVLPSADHPRGSAQTPETTVPTPEPKVLCGPEIFSVSVSEADWILENVFSARNQHMITAAAGAGKTWALGGFGVALAHESVKTFLGQPIRRHGRVFSESWEQGQHEDVRRIQKLVRGYGLPDCSSDFILSSDPPTTLADEAFFQSRLRVLKEWGAIAYVVDSLSEAAGIDLNDNFEYSRWWRARIKPILDLGCMVVFTHLKGHRKAGVGQDRNSASRGATQIRALSHSVLELRQVGETSFSVIHNKHRDSTGVTFGLLGLEGEITDPFVRLVLKTPPAAGLGKEFVARQLLTRMGAAAPPGTAFLRKMIEATINNPAAPRRDRVSKKIWESVLAEMVAEGLFQQGKEGRAAAWSWIGAEDEDDELAPEAED
jgi:hypothetical protein